MIIDLPQVGSAAGNNNARAMLLCDVHNITATLGRFAPELLATRYGEEMWGLFERGELAADSALAREFIEDERSADLAGTLAAIDDAREEAQLGQGRRDAAALSVHPSPLTEGRSERGFNDTD